MSDFELWHNELGNPDGFLTAASPEIFNVLQLESDIANFSLLSNEVTQAHLQKERTENAVLISTAPRDAYGLSFVSGVILKEIGYQVTISPADEAPDPLKPPGFMIFSAASDAVKTRSLQSMLLNNDGQSTLASLVSDIDMGLIHSASINPDSATYIERLRPAFKLLPEDYRIRLYERAFLACRIIRNMRQPGYDTSHLGTRANITRYSELRNSGVEPLYINEIYDIVRNRLLMLITSRPDLKP